MASSLTSKPTWATAKTTLPARPLPLNSTRSPVTTERLIIRALVPEDLHTLHLIRTQPEVMINNPQGRIDTCPTNYNVLHQLFILKALYLEVIMWTPGLRLRQRKNDHCPLRVILSDSFKMLEWGLQGPLTMPRYQLERSSKVEENCVL